MEDEKIIGLFWERSTDAIPVAQKKYGAMCHGIAWNLLRSDEDAEECVNDTWHGLWETIPPERPAKLPPFIARITRNLAMKRLTYLHAEKRSGIIIPFEELNTCLPGGVDPEKVAMERELGRALDAFLDTLDPDSRDMFLRRYWFFDSIEQIAAGFGVSQSKVKSRLFRTRNKLRVYLEENDYGIW